MLARLDFTTLLMVLTLARLLQSACLGYLWRLHRSYLPARTWALGAALVAFGTLLVALRDALPTPLALTIGGAIILAGTLLFDLGILRACNARVPLRASLVVLAAAVIGLFWYAIIAPNLIVRTGIFSVVVLLFHGYTAYCALRSPRSLAASVHRLIGALLVLEAVALPLRWLATYERVQPDGALVAIGLDAGFAVLVIIASMTQTLALAALTSLIDIERRRSVEQAFGKTSRFLDTMLDSAKDVAVIAAEKDLIITVFNAGAERLLGYRADEVIGRCTPAIFADPDEARVRSRELSEQFGRPIRGLGIIVDDAVIGQNRRWTFIRKDGGRVPVAMTVSAMHDAQGGVIGYLGVAQDITAQVAYEDALRREIAKSDEAGRALDTALRNMRQGLAMFDAEQRLIICNDNYLTPYGLTRAEVRPGMLFIDIIKQRIANGFYSLDGPENYLAARLRTAAAMQERDTEELTHLNDGRIIRLIGHRLDGGGWVMTSEDVTEQKRNENRIAYLALHDPLTGLANRMQFKEAMDFAARRLTRDGRRFSVLMLDIDRLKNVNDAFGHAAGDALLKEMARRLGILAGAEDTVARLGGDEFALIHADDAADGAAAPDEAQEQAATALAHRIMAALSAPVLIDGRALTTSTSIGIVCAPRHGREPNELMRKADFALHASKLEGRNACRLFDAEVMDAAQQREDLEADMRLGINRDEFVMYYQPIVDARTRAIVGAEALLRWNHPRLGLLAPGQFIGLAEETGLIVPLGEWIIRRTCSDAAGWPGEAMVAVNLSAVQFRSRDLLDIILQALTESGLAPARLEIEVTESVLLSENVHCVEALRLLRGIGVTVSLDDFGTGYSSLTYLKQFQFDKLKIDRSFTQDIVGEGDSMAIVGAVCSLARGLNMVTTAEGVESEDQMTVLRIAGIDFAQGYLFGKPCPMHEFLDLLAPKAPERARLA